MSLVVSEYFNKRGLTVFSFFGLTIMVMGTVQYIVEMIDLEEEDTPSAKMRVMDWVPIGFTILACIVLAVFHVMAKYPSSKVAP